MLGTDVEKAARIQVMKDFGGHDKDSLFYFQGNGVMGSFGGLWASII